MSGPYEEITPPLGPKHFRCKLCNYETLTKQGMWDHLEHKHPEADKSSLTGKSGKSIKSGKSK